VRPELHQDDTARPFFPQYNNYDLGSSYYAAHYLPRTSLSALGLFFLGCGQPVILGFGACIEARLSGLGHQGNRWQLVRVFLGWRSIGESSVGTLEIVWLTDRSNSGSHPVRTTKRRLKASFA